MNKNEKVAVYIDGGNTYRRLKELNIPKKFARIDYSAFVQHLLGSRELISKRYYVGIVRNINNSEKAEKMVKDQQTFLNGLNLEGFDIKPGKIMYDNGNIREKGVDVKIVVDLVIGAVDDIYDTAIIISSDTDLIPAIKYIRKAKNKNIEYVGFGLNPSLGMIKESSTSRVFSSLDIDKFQKVFFRGVIIEESLENKNFLKNIKIISTKIEQVVEKHKTPWLKQWTLHTVEVSEDKTESIALEISKSFESKHHSWYVDFKNENIHFIIFPNKVFKIDRTSKEQYDKAKEYGISLGIPPHQVDFHPEVKEWKR